MITSQNRPGLPDFSRVTLKNMGRPGDKATCTFSLMPDSLLLINIAIDPHVMPTLLVACLKRELP